MSKKEDSKLLRLRRHGGTCARMTDALDPHPEPAPASDAPDVIYLPHVPPPEIGKKRPKRQRRHVDHFRTDDVEHAELAARAREAGLSVDAYCRWKTLGDPGARSKRAQPTEASRLKAAHVTAINRAGNLVNQGIHALHVIELEAPEAETRDRLADELEAVRKLLESAIPALVEALHVAAFGDVRKG
jgi:hypothetical protein